ncbi:MAG: PQQ-binding-like beta-propeller repeat protein, partial [Planctomycetota bacterium]|nr:PQQ-binding-like beta-propeller repeat protein [Planctomycetota bacterium]
AVQQEPLFRWGGASSSNMVADAKDLPADPGNTEPLWELKLGTHQYSIPTIDRGRIYLTPNDAGIQRAGCKPTGGGVLMCVEQATGKLLWRLLSPRYFAGVKPPYHFDQWTCGICSGPVVDGDRVFVVGGRGEILCLDRDGQANGNDGPFKEELEYMGVAGAPDARLEPTDADIIWKYDLIPALDVVPHDVCGSTILLCGELLYACTSNGIDDRHDKIPRPLAPTLIVLDKKTGRLVARDDERIGQRLLHCNWSSPVAGRVNGKTLIFFGGGDGILYAFEPPQPAPESAPVQILKKLWSYDCNPPDFRARDGKPVPYSAHNRNTPDGPSEIIGTPVFYDGRVYVAIGQSPLHGNGRGCLSCVDAASGAKVWASELVERSLATPAIADGLLYIPDTTGNLHCFDAGTGERYWVHPLESRTWCASAFVADGKVYAGTEANVLWVLKAGKEKQVLSQTRLKSAPITPAAADGVLYLPTQRSLIAIPGKP